MPFFNRAQASVLKCTANFLFVYGYILRHTAHANRVPKTKVIKYKRRNKSFGDAELLFALSLYMLPNTSATIWSAKLDRLSLNFVLYHL